MSARCIDPTELREGDLSAYIYGEAEPRVLQHLAQCPFCQHWVQEYHLLDAWLHAAIVADPALPIPNQGEGYLDPRKQVVQATQMPQPTKPIIIVLGVAPQRMVYTAGDYRVTVRIVPPLPGDCTRTLEGMITPHDEQDASLPHMTIYLRRRKRAIARGQVDEVGVFSFEHVDVDIYTLQIEMEIMRVMIENIEVL